MLICKSFVCPLTQIGVCVCVCVCVCVFVLAGHPVTLALLYTEHLDYEFALSPILFLYFSLLPYKITCSLYIFTRESKHRYECTHRNIYNMTIQGH